eukprot:CAMPEP_0174374216 /NCGR_PEP_ID=MMETSP0811_2-20130205/110093_1 /TAXON_ID=73025 ORGANISM="Eutreptiella gymnastica-like, Strain CCMP1594" /NCGR_SAMPLE_ID=MMETSP0811_2 /ASSEMBLY_ACC=CAM_ASM_000667 /LENGTH=90 /DNA_ID=CAMNT_0015523337 /DNA_START=79 /DNA_END=348 /DNA_ORIENTATION=+
MGGDACLKSLPLPKPCHMPTQLMTWRRPLQAPTTGAASNTALAGCYGAVQQAINPISLAGGSTVAPADCWKPSEVLEESPQQMADVNRPW